MLFTANNEEQEQINKIHEIRSEDYIIVRMTPTMIEKNNIDANASFRKLLKEAEIVDYESLEFGGKKGIKSEAIFIKDTSINTVTLNFYRVNNSRGDRRFSIETIRKKMNNKEINEGDLLYLSVFKDKSGKSKIFMINLTNNIPSKNKIIEAIGIDKITEKFEEIKPRLKEILNIGWVNNSKGKGKKAPKDVGDTLEYLLAVKTNNNPGADIDGLIEIKSKGANKTLDTLFTLRPLFENTPIAVIEPKDRNRVSAFTRIYGYESDKHPDCNSLYITIGSENAPQNNQGFYLDVNDEKNVVNLMWTNSKTLKSEIVAYWTFDDLKSQLENKHPSTLWVEAEERVVEDLVQFRYKKIKFSKAPQFMTFLTLIKNGTITYDWRGYTTKTGTYKGKNHGNAWRIKPKLKDELFGEMLDVKL